MERRSLHALLLRAAEMLVVLLPLSSSSSSNDALVCGDCMLDYCPALPPRGCLLGETRDKCGCCRLCAQGEGEPCGDLGYCAQGLECVEERKRRMDEDEAEGSGQRMSDVWRMDEDEAKGSGRKMSGVCQCKTRHLVCGSDGTTYPNVCQLRAANLKAESQGEKPITQVGEGPCKRGPSIVTPPKDIWNVTGARVYLSCEVFGIPTPVLIWNKVKRGSYGTQRTELLPGDKDNLAIQTRGGPEKHEVTGWVLVSPLTKEEAGEYECHATNSQGEASASAKITVVESLQEIPVKKDEGAEI